jgi:uncharacterized membrane protein YdjX (TVP38/TMEM64 family)
MEVSRATRRQLASLGALGAFAAVIAVVFSPSAVLSSLSTLPETHPVAFFVVLFALYLVRPFLMWPVSALSLTVGFTLGAEVGIPVAMGLTLVSNSIPFALARHVRTDRGLLGTASESGERLVDTTGELRGVIAARLAPLPADVVSTASGLSEVSFGAYLLGTLVGELPWIAAEVIAGSSMQTLSVHGLSHSLSLVVAATVLAGVLLAGPVYRHFRETTASGV